MNINIDQIKTKLVDKLKNSQQVRLVLFGSSNTQRRSPGMHWGDLLELACRLQYGGNLFQSLNVGIGGNTTNDLLGRVDRDAISLSPDAVIMTIGANDAIADASCEKYRNNLLELHKKITESGIMLIFQTYYGCDLENIESFYGSYLTNPPKTAEKLDKFMQIIREVAEETQSPLIDQYERWAPLMAKREYVDKLLMDPLHTTELGNLVVGLHLTDIFECVSVGGDFEKAIKVTPINMLEEMANYVREAYVIHEMLDKSSD